MATFAGENMVAASIPEQTSFAEAGAGCDDGLISDGWAGDMIQWNQVARGQAADAPCAGLQIIDEQRGGKMNLLRQARLFDHPGQVGGFDATIAHGAGDSEACDFRAG